MTRILPGVYVTLNDYSTLPEGENNLTVGYVLKAKRGPIGKCELVTSPTDFLTKFTFSGSPAIDDDTTFWSILQVLKQTNQVYVVRASKNAKFGGLLIKKETELGTISATTVDATSATGGTITVEGDITSKLQANDIIRITGKVAIQGRYKIQSFEAQGEGATTVITLATASATEKAYINMPEAYTKATGDNVKLIKVAAPVPLTTPLADPEAYEFANDDLFLIAGVDPGAYNNDIAITITSDSESPDSLTEKGVFEITVYDAVSGTQLENWMCNRTDGAKAFDGSPVYLNTVLESSAYIRGYNNTAISAGTLPGDCAKARLAGGTDGDTLNENDMIGALELFADKTIPVSILGNGSQTTALYQQAMISIAETRKDCVAFLNTRIADEKAPVNSTKADNIVTYKKSDLGSTSFYATMYAPYVNVADSFNSRTIKIGADATAIAGWLSVILNQGYPFAFAGPTYGLISGVTTNWKIGDTSGEATKLNDASINYVAYDAKVGRYYMQTQNTLQIANSALRNLGAVLNVLDIKETFAKYFKEYLQRPITPTLRAEILMKGEDQMKAMLSQGRVTDYSFADASTDLDISDNTLRYVLTLALTPYAQKIYLVMNVVNQAFDFSILQSA